MGDFVKKRIVFIERTSDNAIRSTGWSNVITTSGGFMEAFLPFNEVDYCNDTGSATNDPADDMSLITDLQFVDSVGLPTILSGGDGNPPLIGGNVVMPRAGKR